MEIGMLVVGVLVGVGIFWVIAFVLLKKKDESPESMLLLQQQIQELTKTLDAKIGETSKQVHDTVRTQLTESTRIIREVTEGLTKLDETNKQVVSFADQLQNLQDILKNPKQRGVLGEYYLETVLKNVMPPKSYAMQYGFDNGEIVDAVVFIREKVLPVDSKFSLENYNRMIEARDKEEKDRYEKQFKADLKVRIDETSKYIRPEENTMDFAFMFIPSEGIYYDLLVGEVGAINAKDLIEYAFSKKVIIVSPTSFLAYLQTVLQGLKQLQVEEKVQDVLKRIHELSKHLKGYEEFHTKLGNTLSTAVNHYNATSREFKKIDKDVTRITGESIEVEVEVLEKPQDD